MTLAWCDTSMDNFNSGRFAVRHDKFSQKQVQIEHENHFKLLQADSKLDYLCKIRQSVYGIFGPETQTNKTWRSVDINKMNFIHVQAI